VSIYQMQPDSECHACLADRSMPGLAMIRWPGVLGGLRMSASDGESFLVLVPGLENHQRFSMRKMSSGKDAVKSRKG
jgi:hypothetical protein